MIIDYFNANQDTFWFVLGFLILAVEVLALGMATGVLLFSGIGALLTGLLMWSGMLPATWLAGVASFGLGSFVSAVLLWKPLLKLQKNNDGYKDTSSDFIGYEFRLSDTLTATHPGKTQYSGIEWRVELDNEAGVSTIAAGERVAVSLVDAGIFHVKPVSASG